MITQPVITRLMTQPVQPVRPSANWVARTTLAAGMGLTALLGATGCNTDRSSADTVEIRQQQAAEWWEISEARNNSLWEQNEQKQVAHEKVLMFLFCGRAQWVAEHLRYIQKDGTLTDEPFDGQESGRERYDARALALSGQLRSLLGPYRNIALSETAFKKEFLADEEALKAFKEPFHQLLKETERGALMLEVARRRSPEYASYFIRYDNLNAEVAQNRRLFLRNQDLLQFVAKSWLQGKYTHASQFDLTPETLGGLNTLERYTDGLSQEQHLAYQEQLVQKRIFGVPPELENDFINVNYPPRFVREFAPRTDTD